MSMLIKKIKNKFLSFIGLELNCFYDYRLFKRFYTKNINLAESREKLEAWILQDKHRIEKAFTLPETRFGFGKDVIPRLIIALKKYKDNFGKDKIYYIGLGSLKAYSNYHNDNNEMLPTFYIDNISKLELTDMSNDWCGLSGYDDRKNNISDNDFSQFMRNRRSCRNFDNEKNNLITNEILENIVELSITSPSVCNRQHWRIHFFSEDKKNQVLNYQNGNAGFKENIPYIAVITSDIRAFYSIDERNQPYTDAGIFSMNVMYAMQYYGLASCPLNWCNSSILDKKFKKLKFIPDYEVVALVIAFGYPSSTALYAKSPRLSVENFYKIH